MARERDTFVTPQEQFIAFALIGGGMALVWLAFNFIYGAAVHPLFSGPSAAPTVALITIGWLVWGAYMVWHHNNPIKGRLILGAVAILSHEQSRKHAEQVRETMNAYYQREDRAERQAVLLAHVKQFADQQHHR